MKLSDREWGEFEVGKLFNVYRTPFFEKRIDNDGKIPYISASKINNGYNFFVKDNFEKSIFAQNHITVEKINLQAFYQPSKFLCSHDVNCLELKNMKMNKNIGLFLVNSFRKQMEKYNYGYICSASRMKKQKFLLPVDTEGNPDYDFMEEYSKPIIDKKIEDYKKYAKNVLSKLEYKKIEPLKNKEWEEFFLIDIFSTIQRGRRLTKQNQILGDIPYISSTSMNNGVDNFIGNKTNVRIFSDCLTIANSGSVGASFYQPYKFVASDHITHLKKENMSKYVYMFISTLTNRFSEKYNFNREINDARISREKIMLPINKEGKPDYEYMEQYSKNLMYKKINQYLNYKNKEA